MNINPIDRLLDLSGKSAIVTGGAAGIGLGIASRLAEAGARVLVADFSREHLDEAKRVLGESGYSVEYCRADVSSPADVAKMMRATVQAFGSVDLLVNNAGIFPNIPLMDMSPEDFDRVLAINLKGVFLATKAAAEQMIKQGNGGRIINISSIDALHPSSVGLAHYDASKHGVWGFTKNAALELAKHEIWVNAVAPGGIDTPGAKAATQNAKVPGTDMQKLRAAFLQRIPMGHMGEPDDIGKVVLFLASDMASYITGTQTVVDGGVLLS